MASYNFYLKNKTAKKATGIYLQFDDGTNRHKLYIEESIHPKNWNAEKREMRKSVDGFADFNAKLDKIQRNCKAIHTALTLDGKFTVETLREKFKTYLNELNNKVAENTSGANQTFDTLPIFVKSYIQSVESIKKKNTILHNRQTLNLLIEFEKVKRRKITFERINLDFYNDFNAFLTESKRYSPNTIGKHIANIKLFLNEASERGINLKFDYKSKRFKVTKETVESIYLTDSEIETIYNHDFSKNRRLEQTRDLFIVGCYTGLRFSDFSELTANNISDGFISVVTQKTKEKVTIPVHPTLLRIFEKYSDSAKGLPRPISNQKMNDYLKEIGREVGLSEQLIRTRTNGGLKVQTKVKKYELLTTHTARRSFATNLYKSGFPSISIMKITGHKTEKAFMTYIKISQEENAEKLREHWAKSVKLKIV